VVQCLVCADCRTQIARTMPGVGFQAALVQLAGEHTMEVTSLEAECASLRLQLDRMRAGVLCEQDAGGCDASKPSGFVDVRPSQVTEVDGALAQMHAVIKEDETSRVTDELLLPAPLDERVAISDDAMSQPSDLLSDPDCNDTAQARHYSDASQHTIIPIQHVRSGASNRVTLSPTSTPSTAQARHYSDASQHTIIPIQHVRSGASNRVTLSRTSTPSTAQARHYSVCFMIRPLWSEVRDESQAANMRRSSFVGPSISALDQMMLGSHDRGALRGRFIVSPGSPYRILWDAGTAMALLHDVLVVPLLLAFVQDNEIDFNITAWIVRVMWTLDMFLSFRTGFFLDDGTIVLEPQAITRRYLKGFFLFDLLVVFLDWFFYLGSDGGSGSARLARIGKCLRAFRFLRMLRLLRVMKLHHTHANIIENVLREVTQSRYVILKILFVVLMFSHLIACMWYHIGLQTIDGVVGWVVSVGLENRSLSQRYTTSLQWAISSFGVGSSSIHPESTPELAFAIGVTLFALVVFSTLISTMSQGYSEMQEKKTAEERDFVQLQLFFRQVRIPAELAKSVQKYLMHQQQYQMHHIHQKDVVLLGMLSEHLKVEVQHHIFESHMEANDVLQELGLLSQHIMRKLAYKAVSATVVADGEFLYHKGEIAGAMLFASDDVPLEALRYSMSMVSDRSRKPTIVTRGSWLCEICLWCTWPHAGFLTAHGMFEIVTLEAGSFGSVISSFLDILGIVREYAVSFVEQANIDFDNAQDTQSARKVMMCYELYGRSEILRVCVHPPASFLSDSICLSLLGRASMFQRLKLWVKSVLVGTR